MQRLNTCPCFDPVAETVNLKIGNKQKKRINSFSQNRQILWSQKKISLKNFFQGIFYLLHYPFFIITFMVHKTLPMEKFFKNLKNYCHL